MKKTLPVVALTCVIIISLILVNKNKKTPIVTDTTVPEAIHICYRYIDKDRAFLKLNITGNTVTGEYQNLPAEKDSKVGTFTGTVGAMDPKISGRVADVWWNAKAEGTTVVEQLHIIFGEGSAVALFGEMVDHGDGTYVYKDVTKLTPGFQMSQTDCDTM